MAFQFQALDIPEVVEVAVQQHGDARGAFAEMYQRSAFQTQGIATDFVQVNYSRSERGVLRGLHYQSPPQAQGKLISVLAGEIFDVAVDIRQGSATYGKWVSRKLSAEAKNMLWVPAGFAHGFCVLSEAAEVMYFVTGSEYAREAEGGIRWDDPQLQITWPISQPILSDKDRVYPALAEVPSPFRL